MRFKYLGLFLFISYANFAYSLNNAGIQIGVSSFEGQPYVLAKMQVSFTPDYFLHLLSHSNKNCEWVDRCTSVSLVKVISKTKSLIKTRISLPWPFKDREMVVLSETIYNEELGKLTIVLKDAGDQFKASKGLVMMTNVNGIWEMAKVDSGLFELSYKGSGDPQGYIPNSVALRYLKISTQRTFENLKQIDEILKKKNEITRLPAGPLR